MSNNFLTTQINLQELSHALLFRCDQSQETQIKVNDFIKKVLCISKKNDLKFCENCNSCLSFNARSHPDFLEIKPDDKQKIGIGSLRGDSKSHSSIIKMLNETPLVSRAKVIKINDADLLTEEAQNHLLKILEEPPKDSYIFMLSSRPYKLKKTILSRLPYFSIPQAGLNKDLDQKDIDYLITDLISKETDISNLSKEDLNSYVSLYDKTIESLEYFNYSKSTILDFWNDDYLNFRLNVLKELIFKNLLNKLKNSDYKDASIISSLDFDKTLTLLESIISLQALMANKVAINKKIQLDSIFDLV
tara:strand:+ start:1006 stop:1917 length:912 start_codon:yes stop_codon:yes gene_type:complete